MKLEGRRLRVWLLTLSELTKFQAAHISVRYARSRVKPVKSRHAVGLAAGRCSTRAEALASLGILVAHPFALQAHRAHVRRLVHTEAPYGYDLARLAWVQRIAGRQALSHGRASTDCRPGMWTPWP